MFRSALVTGGASGIGAATVELLEREGAEVRVLDLSNGFDDGAPAGGQEVGPADFAFLNAGVATGSTDIRDLSDEAYRRAVGANIDGCTTSTRARATAFSACTATA